VGKERFVREMVGVIKNLTKQDKREVLMNEIRCVECGNRFWPSEAQGWEKVKTGRWNEETVEVAVCPECGNYNTHEIKNKT